MGEYDQRPSATLFRNDRRRLPRGFACPRYEKLFLVWTHPNSRYSPNTLNAFKASMRSILRHFFSLKDQNPSLQFTQPHPLIPMLTCEVPKSNHCVPMFFCGAGFEGKKFSCLLPYTVTVFRSPTLFFLHFFSLEKIPKTNHRSAMFAARSRSEHQNEMSGFGNPRL